MMQLFCARRRPTAKPLSYPVGGEHQHPGSSGMGVLLRRPKAGPHELSLRAVELESLSRLLSVCDLFCEFAFSFLR